MHFRDQAGGDDLARAKGITTPSQQPPSLPRPAGDFLRGAADHDYRIATPPRTRVRANG
jgi:hypothetical protein